MGLTIACPAREGRAFSQDAFSQDKEMTVELLLLHLRSHIFEYASALDDMGDPLTPKQPRANTQINLQNAS